MRIETANRLGEVKEYFFSKKLREIQEMRDAGISVINLGIGNPDLPPSENTIEKLKSECVNPSSHGYQSYIGSPQLREAFSNWYKKYFHVDLNPENEILPLIGSKEGIMHISMTYINKGDGVLVPNPGYPTYQSVSKLVEANIIPYDLEEANNWQPNFDKLEEQDLSKVKLMWVNYPNMPTGAKASMQLFEKLIAFGKKHEILICNDNPYSFILNDKPLSILSVDGAKDIAIELNSLSKSHNMAGWRIGMVTGKAEFIQDILRVKSNMDSGMFLPMQLAATEALSNPDSWYEEINKTYRSRREIVWEIFDSLQCEYDKSQVGMFVWAKIPNKYKNSEDLADVILKDAHVFITPGFIFGTNGDAYLRISLCSSETSLNEAKNKIKILIS